MVNYPMEKPKKEMLPNSVSIKQTLWAAMFVMIYIMGAVGILLLAKTMNIITLTNVSVLPILLSLLTLAPILALYFHLFRRNSLTFADLGFRRFDRRMWHLLWQIPAAQIAIITLQGFVMAIFVAVGIDTSSANASNGAMGGIKDLPASLIVVAFLCIAVLTPIWEEVLFRGALLSGLQRRFKPVIALLICSALFAVAHFIPLTLIYLFTLGMILGWLKRFHNNLWAPILLHMFNNALVILVVLTVV